MGEPVDTSAVKRYKWEDKANSDMFYVRYTPEYVLATDYDRLQSALTAAQQRIADLEAQCARVQSQARKDAAEIGGLRAAVIQLGGTFGGNGGEPEHG